MTRPRVTDRSIEQLVSDVLRTGVLLSGGIVLAGGIYYLMRHAHEIPDDHAFHGELSIDRIVPQIVAGAWSLRPRSIIQLGALVLIATPIARVALSLVGFALERDRTYVIVTAIVLAILLFSLIIGAVQG